MTTFETTISQGKRRLVSVGTSDAAGFSGLALGGDARTAPGPDPTSQFYARAALTVGDSTVTVKVDTPTGPSTATLTIHTVTVPIVPDVILTVGDEESDPDA